MKFIQLLKTFVLPHQMIKYKSINLIISICIFVIFSFILGLPVGQNKINSENDILNNYNYDVLHQIPNTTNINNVVTELNNRECSVIDGKELVCENLNEIDVYINTIEFEVDGITKKITFVIDLFDIESVYLEDAKINFDPKERFTTSNSDYAIKEDVENYLVIFSSDSLYYQAHPYGTNKEVVDHNGKILKTESLKIFYQNNIPDFKLDIENSSTEGYKIGDYLLDQLIIGNINTIKLKSFVLSFLVGVCFTLITILILWVFFRRNGKIKNLSEYYNIGAIASVPISLAFFILLWFIPFLIYFYIFVFSLFYLITIYVINTTEDLV